MKGETLPGWPDRKNQNKRLNNTTFSEPELSEKFSRRLIFRFLVNFQASIHPDFSHQFDKESKDFLLDTYTRAWSHDRNGRPQIWSGRKLLEYCQQNHMRHLLFVTVISVDDKENIEGA